MLVFVRAVYIPFGLKLSGSRDTRLTNLPRKIRIDRIVFLGLPIVFRIDGAWATGSSGGFLFQSSQNGG